MIPGKKTLVAPSLLAADFSQLREQIKLVEECGVKLLHLDVMDGHFVPNISFGIPVIESIREHSQLFFDTHLMITNPLAYVADFKKAGANSLTIHIETCSDPLPVFSEIRDLEMRCGLAINPKTPIEKLYPFLEEIDMAVIMSVDPGFGGQQFQTHVLSKIQNLRSELDNQNLFIDIEVDGGINQKNAKSCRDAGATILVSGSTIFSSSNPCRTIDELSS